jgi:hypothetical protein
MHKSMEKLAHLLSILRCGDVEDGKANDLFSAAKSKIAGKRGVAVEEAAINSGVCNSQLLTEEAGAIGSLRI